MTTRTGARVRCLLALAAALALSGACRRGPTAADADALRAAIGTLEAERDRLRARLDRAAARDPRMTGMPREPVRVGIPTSLVQSLTATLVSGLANRVTLELGGLRVTRAGDVHRVITLGRYDLVVNLTRVTARLRAGTPAMTFGRNRVALSLPVHVLSGTASAAIDFRWDGRSLGGAVCGDMEVRETVTGTVAPATYTVRGAIELSGSDEAIIATPRIPRQRIRVNVQPSEATWATVKRLLDSKGGVCGFVLDRVDIPGALRDLLARGFSVRLPTERLRPVAFPVGVAPVIDVDGQRVAMQVTAVPPQITTDMVWLGARVGVADRRLK